jgi:hypothetical protein
MSRNSRVSWAAERRDERLVCRDRYVGRRCAGSSKSFIDDIDTEKSSALMIARGYGKTDRHMSYPAENENGRRAHQRRIVADSSRLQVARIDAIIAELKARAFPTAKARK